MKKIVSIIFLLFFVSIAYSQISLDLLHNMQKKIASIPSFRAEYDMDVSNQNSSKEQYSGEFYFQESFIKIENLEMLVFADRDSKWLCDLVNEEIVIVPIDSSNANFLDDPWLIYSDIDDSYKLNKRYTTKFLGGAKCGVIELKPNNSSFKDVSIELFINIETFLPAGVTYKASANEVTILFSNYKEITLLPTEFFKPSDELMRTFVITDLR